jgi:hypothetical protein
MRPYSMAAAPLLLQRSLWRSRPRPVLLPLDAARPGDWGLRYQATVQSAWGTPDKEAASRKVSTVQTERLTRRD